MEPEALNKLRKLRDCVRRWEGQISAEHMSARRKVGFNRSSIHNIDTHGYLQTAEIISLLYEDAQTPKQEAAEAPALNPTGGVTVKPPLANLVFRKDNTRPGGGIFIAHDTPKEAVDKNLPEGTIIHTQSDCECILASVLELLVHFLEIQFRNQRTSR